MSTNFENQPTSQTNSSESPKKSIFNRGTVPTFLAGVVMTFGVVKLPEALNNINPLVNGEVPTFKTTEQVKKIIAVRDQMQKEGICKQIEYSDSGEKFEKFDNSCLVNTGENRLKALNDQSPTINKDRVKK